MGAAARLAALLLLLGGFGCQSMGGDGELLTGQVAEPLGVAPASLLPSSWASSSETPVAELE